MFFFRDWGKISRGHKSENLSFADPRSHSRIYNKFSERQCVLVVKRDTGGGGKLKGVGNTLYDNIFA